MSKNAVKKLRKWFLDNARDLPWRGNPTPYQVWVSEVMLQQTQVSVVIPYYLLWMERFPDVKSLAKAPLEEVIKTWEGLGYYSRARNLHEGAKYVLENFEGELPCCPIALRSIKGLGPYTVGAILNFAFHKKAAAIDGNVQRVVARYYGIEEEISKASTQAQVLRAVEELLPDEDPWVISEALIELGAKVCTRQPLCRECPLQENCVARLQKKTALIPKKKDRAATIPLHRITGIVWANDSILIRKVQEGKIMGGLYEFPYVQVVDVPSTADPLIEWLNAHGMTVDRINPLTVQKHGFTNYQACLYAYQIRVLIQSDIKGYLWVKVEDVHTLPFPSGHRNLKKYL
ncbi:MAG: A/G-specific adenine glycosylase [Parachlamydiales bacterium]